MEEGRHFPQQIHSLPDQDRIRTEHSHMVGNADKEAVRVIESATDEEKPPFEVSPIVVECTRARVF
jgi:hypothetical protein